MSEPYRGVNEETGEPDESEIRVSAETWRGDAHLVRVQAQSSADCEHCISFYLDGAAAWRLGLELVRLGQEALLLDAGWRPADLSHEDAQKGDWTPPEDRENFWEFDLAVNKVTRRKGRS